MATQGEDEQKEEVGILNGVWPPPPIYEPPRAAAPRLPRLPFLQMLKGFGLPEWAGWAFSNITITVIAPTIEHYVSPVGEVLVGILVVYYSFLICSLLFWIIRVLRTYLANGWQQQGDHDEVMWERVLPMLGGRMDLVPLLVFWLWGISYLGIYHIHQINSVARIIWAAWFVLGCVVAVANGVGKRLQGRSAPTGVGPE